MEIALERIYGHRLALPQVGAAPLFSQEVPPDLLGYAPRHSHKMWTLF